MNLKDILGHDTKKDILDTVNQMYKKKLLPERARKLIYDNIDGMASQYMIQVFKEWSCTSCHITVQGPKFLLLQHQKIHADQAEIKENENMVIDYKLY